MSNYFPLDLDPQSNNLPEIGEKKLAELQRVLDVFKEKIEELKGVNHTSFLDFLRQLSDILQRVRFRDIFGLEDYDEYDDAKLDLDDTFELGDEYLEGQEIDFDSIFKDEIDAEIEIDEKYTKAEYLRFPELLVIDLIAFELEDLLSKFADKLAIPKHLQDLMPEATERVKNKRAVEAENHLRKNDVVEFLSDVIVEGVEIEKDNLLKNVDESVRENVARKFDLRVARAKTYILGLIAPWIDPNISTGNKTNQEQ